MVLSSEMWGGSGRVEERHLYIYIYIYKCLYIYICVSCKYINSIYDCIFIDQTKAPTTLILFDLNYLLAHSI